MNKEEFLKKLEKELSILNEQERQDILNEYKDTIEEKVKHGQTEKEAVKDFGDLNELVSGILNAYKIDPKYGKNDASFDKLVSDGETLIKKGADNLAHATKEISKNITDNNEINLSFIFEIIIKALCLIVFLGLLKIPFTMFKDLGTSVFENFFEPIGSIMKVIWLIFLSVLYVIAAVIIAISLFKKYFKKDNDSSEMSKDQENNQKSNSKVKIESPKNNSEKSKLPKKQTNSVTLASVLMLFLKICAIIFVVIPFIFVDGGLLFATVFSIFYWIQGIDLLGLTLLTSGLSIISIWLTMLIYKIIFTKDKIKFYPIIIGLITAVVGLLLFINFVTSVSYYNTYPNNYKFTTIDNTYTVDKPVYIENNDSESVKKQIDETLADNIIKIKIVYDKKLFDIKLNKNDNYTFEKCENCDNHDGTYNYFNIFKIQNNEINIKKSVYNEFIKNLKNKKVYNYDKLYHPEITVSANSKTINNIETN